MNQLDRYSVVSIEDTIVAIKNFTASVYNLSDIDKLKALKKNRTPFFGQDIRLGSVRLQTFLHYGITCVTCKKEAEYFAIERHKENENYHINLYGKKDDGSELLFTHDHILARSLGGADSIKNTQPMCTVCNSIKSVEEKLILMERKKKKNLNQQKIKV